MSIFWKFLVFGFACVNGDIVYAAKTLKPEPKAVKEKAKKLALQQGAVSKTSRKLQHQLLFSDGWCR